MSYFIHHIALFLSGSLPIISLFTTFLFLYENEKHAYLRSGILSIFLTSFFIFQVLKNSQLLDTFVISCGAISCFLLILPIRNKKKYTAVQPKERVDERDTMFSRAELKIDTARYHTYYKSHPEHLNADNRFRQKAGLLAHQALLYHPYAFKQARSNFEQIGKLHHQVTVTPNKTALKTDKHVEEKLKELALSLGALNVGITQTHDYHFYSYGGRAERYGNAIQRKHKYAIAFTLEMDHDMVMSAPKASIVLESSKQYLKGAQIAIKLASTIGDMGYEARAHIDGNYEVICPLVARDAGLGEIGRMGLLMTPNEGPRVRLGVVSTNLPLKIDTYKADHSVEDFCRLCKKCALCCPSQSIPHDSPAQHGGVKRWKINAESCYTYWCITGTDCGRCMAVCPYSHPNTLFHNIIRFGIKHSGFFRILALQADNFFYGKKPKSKPLPHSLQHKGK